jgi:formate hydrogenlyase subunit 4
MVSTMSLRLVSLLIHLLHLLMRSYFVTRHKSLSTQKIVSTHKSRLHWRLSHVWDLIKVILLLRLLFMGIKLSHTSTGSWPWRFVGCTRGATLVEIRHLVLLHHHTLTIIEIREVAWGNLLRLVRATLHHEILHTIFGSFVSRHKFVSTQQSLWLFRIIEGG